MITIGWGFVSTTIALGRANGGQFSVGHVKPNAYPSRRMCVSRPDLWNNVVVLLRKIYISKRRAGGVIQVGFYQGRAWGVGAVFGKWSKGLFVSTSFHLSLIQFQPLPFLQAPARRMLLLQVFITRL